MGIVFRAEDSALKREVALKVIHPHYASNPSAKARFLREARAQASVEHDHVAVIYQVGEDRGIPFIAMPLLKGRTLADALHANQLLPLLEAVRIAREVAEGLAAAHDRGLIHRDIKPSNVWLEGKRQRVKILDFGLARGVIAEGTDQGSELVTQEGALLGTPAYMSPEQAKGEPLDARCDLFSLGVLLFQMLTGQLPFRAPNTTTLLLAVVSGHAPPPSNLNPRVPSALDALTQQMLAKTPADRPEGALAVVEALRAVEINLASTG